MMYSALEIRRIESNMEQMLVDFFRGLVQSGDEHYFHPHPFDAETARWIADYDGQDLYYGIVNGRKILSYGMLRGWDDGYLTPSLGIATAREARRIGLGRILMSFMHAAARQRGAKWVRLSVYPSNTAAVNLYRELGYVFQNQVGEQLVGMLKL